MSDMRCPSLQRLKFDVLEQLCPHHKFAYKANCAHRNVLLLRKFYHDNIPSLERSLKIFFRTEHLSFMSPIDIAQLPKTFLTIFGANSIEHAWDKLPEDLKNDKEILNCLRCRDHNYMATVVPPLRRDCIKCTLNANII